jgi:hypothetical protein
MERKRFIKAITKGVICMATLSGFKNFTNSDFSNETTGLNSKKQKKNMERELATFGPVHLNVTNLQRSVAFAQITSV